MKLVRKLRGTVSFENLAELFADIKIVCNDGVLLWNRSLLAASSPFLKGILSEDDSFIILDSFTTKTVKKCISTLSGKMTSQLEEDESLLQVLLINFYNKQMKVEDDQLNFSNEVKLVLKEEYSDSDDNHFGTEGGNFSDSDEQDINVLAV